MGLKQPFLLSGLCTESRADYFCSCLLIVHLAVTFSNSIHMKCIIDQWYVSLVPTKVYPWFMRHHLSYNSKILSAFLFLQKQTANAHCFLFEGTCSVYRSRFVMCLWIADNYNSFILKKQQQTFEWALYDSHSLTNQFPVSSNSSSSSPASTWCCPASTARMGGTRQSRWHKTWHAHRYIGLKYTAKPWQLDHKCVWKKMVLTVGWSCYQVKI